MKKRFIARKLHAVTKEQVFAAARVVSQLLTAVVTKRPGLAPLQMALNALLVAENKGVRENTKTLVQLRKLKRQLETASDKDQKRLRHQIDVLTDLLIEDEGEV